MTIGKVIMVQGTSSSAGKSMLVAGLCRVFARKGIKVAPFKAQNMSNNAGVCADGSEIGRAQITQAYASGIEPTAAMNPVLLKPESNMRSQVVVMGKAMESLPAKSYYQRKQMLWGTVTAALDALREEYELIIVEGAGSPVEMNLKPNDIVNMAIARYAEAPVILVGDIDRGGIFPQLLGTLWLFDEVEQKLLHGFVVNKFRGDITLFDDGIEILEERSGKPVLGVMPWLKDLYLPEEDGVALDQAIAQKGDNQKLDLVVIRIPRISNFDDFDPLEKEPNVSVRYVQNPADLGEPDAIIVPGTKSTISDMAWLRDQGFVEPIQQLNEAGVALVGICGGYQMFGQMIYDPDLVEADQPEIEGIGILPYDTTFVGEKATYQSVAEVTDGIGWMKALIGQSLRGYEIHMGRTESDSSWLKFAKRGSETVNVPDGAMADNGRIWGCYMHGIFENDSLRHAWLNSLGLQQVSSNLPSLDESLERLADELEKNLDLAWIDELLKLTVVR
ncbi:MAG: cobyric acid synthase [Chloroflexota bacterium]